MSDLGSLYVRMVAWLRGGCIGRARVGRSDDSVGVGIMVGLEVQDYEVA